MLFYVIAFDHLRLGIERFDPDGQLESILLLVRSNPTASRGPNSCRTMQNFHVEGDAPNMEVTRTLELPCIVGFLRAMVSDGSISVENTSGFHVFGLNAYEVDTVVLRDNRGRVVDTWKEYLANKTSFENGTALGYSD